MSLLTFLRVSWNQQAYVARVQALARRLQLPEPMLACGLGAFPVVLSTNLFLWFKDDYYYLQFLMLLVAVFCKELFSWTREGRRMHIFNPSAIALCTACIFLIIFGKSQVTWAFTISKRWDFLHTCTWGFLHLDLLVQALFSVTLVTFGAALTLYGLNIVFTALTGVYYFADAGISVSLFLGLHFLVTDPATSPRNPIGKFTFGALYGLSAFCCNGLLTWAGAPPFYDKLLPVPVLNLCVRALDRWGNNVAVPRA